MTQQWVTEDDLRIFFNSDDVSSVCTPLKELRGFERVHLKSNETQTVYFEITSDDLALWNSNLEFVVEPGTFTIMVGASSEDIHLEGKLEVVATL